MLSDFRFDFDLADDSSPLLTPFVALFLLHGHFTTGCFTSDEIYGHSASGNDKKILKKKFKELLSSIFLGKIFIGLCQVVWP